MTDLNTLDDWWNEGFDDFFEGAKAADGPENDASWCAWYAGYCEARKYRNAMKEPTDE